jgi:alkylation response protein AidB-like acyl-CoA dehydrogenase
MSASTQPGVPIPHPTELGAALAEIAEGAEDLDRRPRFPSEAFDALRGAGALGSSVGGLREGRSVEDQWNVIRQVAAADGSVGRILDGHFNAIERLEVAAPPTLRDEELGRVVAGERLLGVWGADPRPQDGDPARIVTGPGGDVLNGAKTFCSGAGGLDAVLVMVGSDDGQAPSLVLIDGDERLEIDHGWYRAAGLRASESHLVRFREAPILAVLGKPGELGKEPWFSRDAMRTAASWVGMLDAAAEAALGDLVAHRVGENLAELAVGRIGASHGTAQAWLERAARVVDGGDEDLSTLSVEMRAEIERAAKTLLDTAAAACGSTPFVSGARLDRARRDLETFLLQHRLEPLLARVGAERMERRR